MRASRVAEKRRTGLLRAPPARLRLGTVIGDFAVSTTRNSLRQSDQPAGTNSAPWPVRSRRPSWRQHLVDAEHGLREGLQRDSTLCIHLFLDCVILVVCGVFGLAAWQWVALSLALTGMLVAEFFHHALRVMASLIPDQRAGAHVQRLGTAGALVAAVGGLATILLLLADRAHELFGR